MADWLLPGLFALPLGLALAKLPILPISSICRVSSITELSAQFYEIHRQRTVRFFRCCRGALSPSLGVKVLGLFRLILMAAEFDIVGILQRCIPPRHLASAAQDRRPLRTSGHAVERRVCAAVCAFSGREMVGYCLPRTLCLSSIFPELLWVQAGCILLIKNHREFPSVGGANPVASWPSRTGGASGVQTICSPQVTKSERMNVTSANIQGVAHAGSRRVEQ
ncbi:hypothetical protein NKI94_29515 [Mesorhizobium australicum]|uniref:hypothetical protein n=1 Tax=Mesorhizobium australicum TaxID=536018 RepID=UPI0033373AF9